MYLLLFLPSAPSTVHLWSVPLKLVSVCLGCWQLSACIHNKDQRDDDPQHIHEHKVEPEVDGVSQLTVSISISVLCEEVKHYAVQLTWNKTHRVNMNINDELNLAYNFSDDTINPLTDWNDELQNKSVGLVS